MKDEFVRNQSAEVVQVWDRVAGNYDPESISGADFKADIHHLLAAGGNPAGRSYCEVGCGSGLYSGILAQLGARVTLVDISPRSLQFAFAHFQKHGLAGQFCLQNALNMGFKDGSFDVVWNGGTLEHFDDEGKVRLLREMWRIVRPGGVLYVLVPNHWDLPFMVGKWLAIRRGTWPFGFEDDFGAGKFRRLAADAEVVRPRVFAYNPVSGWWFLPYGRPITERLGLNTEKWHRMRSPFGHILTLVALKGG